MELTVVEFFGFTKAAFFFLPILCIHIIQAQTHIKKS